MMQVSFFLLFSTVIKYIMNHDHGHHHHKQRQQHKHLQGDEAGQVLPLVPHHHHIAHHLQKMRLSFLKTSWFVLLFDEMSVKIRSEVNWKTMTCLFLLRLDFMQV